MTGVAGLAGPEAEGHREIERELRRYYQVESDLRRHRPLRGRRVRARNRVLAGVLAPAAVRGPVLDLGSGPGLDTVVLRAAGHRVVAVDLAPANAGAAGAPALVASAVELPLADRSVAAVWSMSALMHVPDVAIGTALAELARVVAPGGTAVLGTWGGPDLEHRPINDELGLPRNFSRRSDVRWRALLEAALGPLECWESWPDTGAENWHYQWAEVRVQTPV